MRQIITSTKESIVIQEHTKGPGWEMNDTTRKPSDVASTMNNGNG